MRRSAVVDWSDHTIEVAGVFGPFAAIVTTEALDVLQSEMPSVSDPEKLIDANRAMLEQLATMKFEAGDGYEPRSVRISGGDLEK